MKKYFVVLLALAFWSCGKDNSTTVNIQVDGNGCFISASDFDERSEFARQGLRTVNYVWECADYVSLVNGTEFLDKRVSLTFTGTTCLQFQGELVSEGHCLVGKVPLVQ